MKGKKLLPLAMAALLLMGVLSGCSDSAEDILGMVGETPIYRWQYDANLVNQLALYERYYGVDLTEPGYYEQYNEYRVKRLEDMVDQAAVKEEARKQGLYELTAEQEAEIDAEYIAYYERNLSSFMERYGTDEAGRREAEKAYEKMLSDSSLNPERVRLMLKDEYVARLLIEAEGRTVSITDEEVRTEYDRLLKEQQEGCAEDVNWLGEMAPSVIVYAPEGYVKTLRIRKGFTEKQYAELGEAANNALDATEEYEAAVMEDGEDSITAGIKKSALERVTAVYDSIYARVSEEAMASMEQFRATVGSAEQFREILPAETSDTNIVNYYVCPTSTHVEEDYRDAAMALENEGDISDPVMLLEGPCIILLEEKLEPGVRPFEDVEEGIRNSLSANATVTQGYNMRDEYGSAAREAGIVTLYPDKL